MEKGIAGIRRAAQEFFADAHQIPIFTFEEVSDSY